MLGITILNCVLIIVAFFIDDLETLAVFNTFDTVFLVIYATDILVKIIAIGIFDFFDDGWNVFDLSLVILQICFDYILFNVVSGNIV
jgi:two pore calcium channel protein 1/two pore calcium channel protein 3